MKTKFFFFAMLVCVTASAQSTVQITPISATYTSTPTIKFKVSWTSQTTANHRNKVWVFVDFQPVISPAQKGVWQPATITGTVQKTAGTVSGQSNRGFFLEGRTTNFSSTVTVRLSNISTTKFNWCAYGSDFPPNAVASGSGYTLKGTPPFILTTTTGTVAVNAKTFSGGTITALTDATGCPGVLCGKNGEAPGLLGCCNGMTNCSGTCKTNDTYTKNDGACSGACHTAYVRQYNQCEIVINEKYGNYNNANCSSGCGAAWGYCDINSSYYIGWLSRAECIQMCGSKNYKFYYNTFGEEYDEAPCYCCN
jgi:hypothetical protein